jgi:hypothetical protein
VKGYSTKYALTTGIAEVEIDMEYSRGGCSGVCDAQHPCVVLSGGEHVPKYVYSGRDMGRQQFVTGKDFFLTRAEAAEATVKAAKAKIKAAKKQIARLEDLIETESAGTP